MLCRCQIYKFRNIRFIIFCIANSSSFSLNLIDMDLSTLRSRREITPAHVTLQNYNSSVHRLDIADTGS